MINLIGDEESLTVEKMEVLDLHTKYVIFQKLDKVPMEKELTGIYPKLR